MNNKCLKVKLFINKSVKILTNDSVSVALHRFFDLVGKFVEFFLVKNFIFTGISFSHMVNHINAMLIKTHMFFESSSNFFDRDRSIVVGVNFIKNFIWFLHRDMWIVASSLVLDLDSRSSGEESENGEFHLWFLCFDLFIIKYSNCLA